MGPKRKTTHSEKLDEIKQMQKSWMKQRSDQSEDSSHSPSRETDRKKKTVSAVVKKNMGQPKDRGSISWVVGGGAKTKGSLRTRSASPSSRKNTSPSSQNSSGHRTNRGLHSKTEHRGESRSRPPSGRSDTSSTISDQSRVPPLPAHRSKGTKPSSKFEQKYTSRGRNKSTISPKATSPGDCDNDDPSSMLNHSLAETDLSAALDRDNCDVSFSTEGATNQNSKEEAPNEQSSSCSRDDDQLPTVVSNGLLDPSQFDSLAERLSQKVRGHILEEERKSRMNHGVTHDSILLDEGVQSNNSHSCPKCKQTMVPPDHTPTLLVPCGHTLCEPCAEDRIKCPQCRTKVSSTSVNGSLLGIILKSLGRAPEGMESSHRSPEGTPDRQTYEERSAPSVGSQTKAAEPERGKAYDPLNFTSGGESHRTNTYLDNDRVSDNPNDRPSSEFHSTFAPLRNGDPSEQQERYTEEYESLSIRCEAYENEEEIILERVEKKGHEIDKQKNQIDNIHREQQRIRDEIQSLQEKLSVLAAHEQEFNRQHAALEEIRQGDREQLETVRNTKKGLKKQKEKIKVLGRGIGLFFD